MYLEHGSIPRSGLGPHYFLHQKSKSTFAVDGSPIAGACLFDRNFESTVLRLRSEEWRIMSIFFAVSPERFLFPNWSRILKTSSSKILKGKVHDGFSWQNGYGAFSVSQSARKSLFSYLADQEIHHRRMTFQEEFRALLNKHETVLMSGMCGIDP